VLNRSHCAVNTASLATSTAVSTQRAQEEVERRAIEDNPEIRTRYGEWLRRRREEAGLTRDAPGERAIMSRTHLAHIEAGRRRPSEDDARRLDDVLATGGVFEAFLPSLDGKSVAEHFGEAAELEPQATVIREYAPKLVPGILPRSYEARTGSRFCSALPGVLRSRIGRRVVAP
jgi:transcriptional regulator with XRE-family HTH domain